MTWCFALVGVVLVGMMAMINLMTNHFIAKIDALQLRAVQMEKRLDIIKQDLDRLLEDAP
jgi:site-specific recombinase